jgi:hypothetical protein
LDTTGQVVFFTPKGKALLGAPPVVARWAGAVSANAASEGAGGVVGDDSAAPDLRLRLRPAHRSGAAKWTRDSDIPYEVEARVWDALDSA